MKLTQNDPILTLAFNPITHELFSGGASDFTLYIPGRKEIPKEKFKEKIISSAWSADGQTLAFGTINGTISFRARSLDEKVIVNIFRIKYLWEPQFGAWNGLLFLAKMRNPSCLQVAGIRLSTSSTQMVKRGIDSAKDTSLVIPYRSTSIPQASIS